MNKEFIPYEQALELKELGFDEECIRVYYLNMNNKYILTHGKHNEDIPAPLYQQAFRWFREKYGLMGVVDCFFYNFSYTYNINDIENEKIISLSDTDNDFKSYEEAELDCLKKLIEIAKNK